LAHVAREDTPDEDVKFIGIYSSREKAESAISRLVLQQGFKDFPDGFNIDQYTIDEDHWTEGFVTCWS